MGGGFCLLLADRGVFDAIAPNYGPFPPATGVPSRSCPIVASCGAEDRLLPGRRQARERLGAQWRGA